MSFENRDYQRAGGRGYPGGGMGGGLGGGGLMIPTPARGSVTFWLLIINCAVLFLDGLLARGIGGLQFYNGGPVLRPIEAWTYFSADTSVTGLQLWRWITFQFQHAGVGHLLGNMLGLFFFGPMVERFFGPRRFLAFWLLCGVGGALAYLIFWMSGIVLSSSAVPLVGASAGVYGTLVAAAILAPNSRVLLFFLIPIPLRVLIWGILGIAAFTVLAEGGMGGNNAGGEAAHLGGAILGWLFVKAPGYLKWADNLAVPDVKGAIQEKQQQRASMREQLHEEEVDRILAKVKDQGLGSLSEAEKRVLNADTERKRQGAEQVSALTYELFRADGGSAARLGRVTTPHGSFDTPAFMPVGTQGTVKGLLPSQIGELGAQIVLGNTYHLMLRPGSELVAEMGGLQTWTGWNRPMLTDSGGFQVFSLGNLNRIDDDGVRFKSHIDGRSIELTPQRSMQVQHELGADIIMAFDDCPPAAAPSAHQTDRTASFRTGTVRRKPEAFDAATYERRVREANERTLRWLDQCQAYHRQTGRDQTQALFGIVQGGTDLAQRDACLDAVCSHDLPGYAIGGVAVGEPPEEIRRVVAHTADRLPADRPRYLMGVGYPADIVAAVRAGVDMFDCVLPSRNGRNGHAFLPDGVIRLRNATHARDPRPIEHGCDCAACAVEAHGTARFSRSYLRHLFVAGEMLGPILVSLHNQRLYQRLMLDIRAAIADDAWLAFAKRWPCTAAQVPAD